MADDTLSAGLTADQIDALSKACPSGVVLPDTLRVWGQYFHEQQNAPATKLTIAYAFLYRFAIRQLASEEPPRSRGALESQLATINAVNGHEPLGDGQSTVAILIEQMGTMTKNQRLSVFMMIDDFFCRRCGVEQPLGDCQCGEVKRTEPDE